MKTYTIYHINGVKIGCTSQLKKRLSDQGFTNCEILEEHTDIYEASNREIELQKQYGYRVDDVLYWISVQNRYKFSREDAAKGGRNSIDQMRSYLTKEALAKGGAAGKGKPKPKTECMYCNRLIANHIINRFHNNNCKLKP